MPIAAHDVSVALFVRALTNLKTLLHKAEQHTASHHLADAELLESQLSPDMQNLASQIHWATQSTRLAVARLLGTTPAAPEDDAKTFADLKQRVDAVLAYLRGVSAADIEAGLTRAIEIEHRGGRMSFTGDRFLREFAVPSFFFHLTNAYALLVQRGVDVNKRDFMGSMG